MEQGTIKINAGFVFIQFLLYFFKPVVSIDDGDEKKIPWGEIGALRQSRAAHRQHGGLILLRLEGFEGERDR